MDPGFSSNASTCDSPQLFLVFWSEAGGDGQGYRDGRFGFGVAVGSLLGVSQHGPFSILPLALHL
jgi:hypothetical protein